MGGLVLGCSRLCSEYTLDVTGIPPDPLVPLVSVAFVSASRSTTSGAGDSSGSGGSSRRRSAGKLQSRSNSLSRKTLSIVNNLQPQTVGQTGEQYMVRTVVVVAVVLGSCHRTPTHSVHI